jgi:hypothetical protein
VGNRRKLDLIAIDREKKRLIHAQYWSDLIRVKGYWPTMILATNYDDVKTFKKECKRLNKLGVPKGLLDVIGDGNCLYYCMLTHLVEVDPKIGSTMGNNYPLVWIRKLIKAGGLLIDDIYWLGISGSAKEERINFFYDPNFNTMDDELTRDSSNVDYQGDLMAVVIFAALFKCRVVMYQATLPLLT